MALTSTQSNFWSRNWERTEDWLAFVPSGIAMFAVFGNIQSLMVIPVIIGLIGKAVPSLTQRGRTKWGVIEDWLLLSFAALALVTYLLIHNQDVTVLLVTFGIMAKTIPSITYYIKNYKTIQRSHNEKVKEIIEDGVTLSFATAGLSLFLLLGDPCPYFQLSFQPAANIAKATTSLVTKTGEISVSPHMLFAFGGIALVAISSGSITPLALETYAACQICAYDFTNESSRLSVAQSAFSGYEPLTVGFYLNGSLSPESKITWYFGDNTSDGSSGVLVQKHDYPSVSSTTTYNGNVRACDISNREYGILPFNVTESRFNDQLFPNLGVSQNQGAIHTNDKVGFSVGGDFTGTYGEGCEYGPKIKRDLCIVWNFGDNSSIPLKNVMNPNHQYGTSGTFKGTARFEYDSNSLAPYYHHYAEWPFSVLVVPQNNYQIQEWTGTHKYEGYDLWPQNQQIQFSVYPQIQENARYTWNFGDNTVNSTWYNQINHVYANSGNYTVTLTVSTYYGNQYNLSKTVEICPNPENIDVCQP